MNYIEVDIFLSKKKPFTDIITAKLNEIEFESYQQTEYGLQAYIQEKLFNKDLLNNAFSILENKVDFSFKIKEIKQQNWNASWESSFQPVVINEKCIVRAAFHQKTDVEFEIVITPKMSFGTGHHATTFLMMSAMFNLDFINKTILDIGSGTGVLSVLAEKLGAKNILGIDIDNWAFENSKENTILNNCNRINFEIGDISNLGDKKFDVILTNINRNIILKDLDNYSAALNSGGQMLLSGFYTDDESLILSKAEKLNLNFQMRKQKDNWLLLHLQK